MLTTLIETERERRIARILRAAAAVVWEQYGGRPFWQRGASREVLDLADALDELPYGERVRYGL